MDVVLDWLSIFMCLTTFLHEPLQMNCCQEYLKFYVKHHLLCIVTQYLSAKVFPVMSTPYFHQCTAHIFLVGDEITKFEEPKRCNPKMYLAHFSLNITYVKYLKF